MLGGVSQWMVSEDALRERGFSFKIYPNVLVVTAPKHILFRYWLDSLELFRPEYKAPDIIPSIGECFPLPSQSVMHANHLPNHIQEMPQSVYSVHDHVFPRAFQKEMGMVYFPPRLKYCRYMRAKAHI